LTPLITNKNITIFNPEKKLKLALWAARRTLRKETWHTTRPIPLLVILNKLALSIELYSSIIVVQEAIFMLACNIGLRLSKVF
jgi:hypothetical protein